MCKACGRGFLLLRLSYKGRRTRELSSSLCIPFERSMWNDFRFVASNVIYDFESLGEFTTGNLIIDEEDWAVIA